MILFGAGILCILLGWIPGFALKKASAVDRSGMILTVLGCGLVLAASIAGLSDSLPAEVYRIFWRMPFGEALFSLSPLSCFFLFVIALISGLAAVYAPAYLRRHGEDARRSRRHWLCYEVLAASMMFVVVAQNAVFFMFAWELMSLSSFFLVEFRNEKAGVRRAGWMYLVFTHIGAAFLLAMFALLARNAGSLDFVDFRNSAASMPRPIASIVFVFGVVGFGMKAGFFPAHVWLPEAHPSAPSHVSALMSGVMIKTAIYGILLVLSFLAPALPWQGWLLLIVGLLSGILGIGMAISRNDLKALLAYSSVENIGIIAVALGVGVLGQASGNDVLSYLGFGAALLHVLNHSLFKSLLFLGSGAIQSSTGTLDLNHMGGLLRRMPITGAAMLAGMAAICGFPPFNGFISEFLIYSSTFRAVFSAPITRELFIVLVLGGLALIGALAAYAFAKLAGIGLLGEPRSEGAARATEAAPAMYVPMVVLALLCLVIGLFPQAVVGLLGPILADMGVAAPSYGLEWLTVPLGGIQNAAVFTLLLMALLAAARRLLLKGKPVRSSETWGCGYDKPDSRMQYTSTSFAEPFVSMTAPLLKPRREGRVPAEYFPKETKFETEVGDPVMDKAVVPAYASAGRWFEKFSVIQHGNTHLYVLYIVLALLAALVWGLSL